ncbi:ABC transporter ATP-binding protein [Roseobacter litoralis]|uniref:Oligopeptide transport ATP-binding protein n=1 Tax=Roseobacter litoralis (strain ATCC 49566 / DSM 6996 / JCM 21268 / NBRC 15278 / OCh 149) TaxID=391595 RepID=F7ZLK7_ROSLO|nr:oligopeptide/dipeptide ABC transporter ATP-binding protein [Roseobacter litoralis]AEI94058.1 oligopeptide transport ATP-binding protein [Roseobacter litoralis Och 149]
MSNLLEVRNLSKVFTSPGGPFRKARAMHAVNDVSFDLPKGRVIGVVGESGCGKSTLARLILRLIEPSSGTLRFDGDDLLAKTSAEMRKLRADMQMVFQDPYSAIDPRYTVARAVMEPFDVQGREHAGTRESVIAELLEMVGMNAGLAGSFPHQISGGQKQRVGIARALALRPSLLVLDEPTASLDVSVQAQIISLLEQLRDDLGLTYLFISHDLSLVRYFCDEIMVMYLGRVVEALPDTEQPARHPYTKTLMDSTFAPTPNQRRVITPLEGEVPSPFDLPPGCAFVDRCPHATAICTSETPVLSARGGHAVACHNPL